MRNLKFILAYIIMQRQNLLQISQIAEFTDVPAGCIRVFIS